MHRFLISACVLTTTLVATNVARAQTELPEVAVPANSQVNPPAGFVGPGTGANAASTIAPSPSSVPVRFVADRPAMISIQPASGGPPSSPCPAPCEIRAEPGAYRANVTFDDGATRSLQLAVPPEGATFNVRGPRVSGGGVALIAIGGGLGLIGVGMTAVGVVACAGGGGCGGFVTGFIAGGAVFLLTGAALVVPGVFIAVNRAQTRVDRVAELARRPFVEAFVAPHPTPSADGVMASVVGRF